MWIYNFLLNYGTWKLETLYYHLKQNMLFYSSTYLIQNKLIYCNLRRHRRIDVNIFGEYQKT